MRLKRLFNSKSIVVFIIVALCFHFLYRYRANVNALPAGTPAPELELTTLDGQKFSLYDYGIPVMLVFLNTKTVLSSSVYPDLILRRMPMLNLLKERDKAGLIVLLDTEQTPEAIKDIISTNKYKILENNVYISNIKIAKEKYGLTSWPHFFMIDETHTVIYESKIPSMDTIDSILKGR